MTRWICGVWNAIEYWWILRQIGKMRDGKKPVRGLKGMRPPL